jgi:hypothetical protein
MKELSKEEKAKAYDRVSKEVKDFFEGKQKMYNDVEQTLEYLFPDLKESEDEKIRKDIIFYIKAIANNENISPDSKKECKTWIAWLEKQGREKPQRMISAEAKEAMYDKPAWNEKDEKEYKYVLKFVDNILNNCGNKKDYEHCKRCYDWLKSLKQRIGE